MPAPFPLRYQRYRDNFALLHHAPVFEFKNYNANARYAMELPTVLTSDDASYP